MQLTPNFHLGEFVREGDLLEPKVLENIKALANRLQVIRDLLGKPIQITSGYRSSEHNKAVGGASESYHTNGMGCDLVVKGMTPGQVYEYLKNWSGGMGLYANHIHLDIRPYKARWTSNKP